MKISLALSLVALCGLAATTIAQPAAQPAPAKPAPAAPAKPADPVKPVEAKPVAQPVPAKPGNAPQGPLSETAKISFEATEKNFGIISDEKNVEAEFKFKNTGSSQLEIFSTSGSCGCTVPALSKKSYAPGEEGVITVQYHPQNRRGPQHTTVTVNSNDASNPQLRLDVKSEVRPLVMLDPQMLNLGQVPKGKGGTFKLSVTSRLKDVAPTTVTPTIATISAKLLPGVDSTAEGDQVMTYPIEVTVPADAAVGQIMGNISIRTSDPARVLTCTVTGEVVGDVQGNPARVQLGSLAPGQSFTSELRLTSRSGKPFKITKIEEMPSTPSKSFTDITFKEVPGATPQTWLVTMNGAASATAGAMRGDLVVATDVPGEEQLKFNYFGFVRATPPKPAPTNAWDAEPSTLVPNNK